MSKQQSRARMLAAFRKMPGFDGKMVCVRERTFFVSPSLRPCVCGAVPVVAFDMYSPVPAMFVRCPVCDRRVADSGPFDFVRDQWNARRFSPVSEMLARPMTHMDDEGFLALMNAIFQGKE